MVDVNDYGDKAEVGVVKCTGCGMRMETCHGQDEADKRWNRRDGDGEKDNGLGPCGYARGVTADELHLRVINAVGRWCERRGGRAGLDARDRFLVDHLSRPLEQTITGVLSLLADELGELRVDNIPYDPTDPVRYLTDDRDALNRNELVLFAGGNGDWYVGVVPEGEGFGGRCVRICTSGGAASAVPGLGVAIAKAYLAIAKVTEGGGA
jgi:hypothetical protein